MLLVLFSILQVIHAQSCPGGTTTTLSGCTGKCVYQISDGVMWQPTNPISISAASDPVYFSSITCTSEKKNLKLEMSSEEDDWWVCVAPTTAGQCFSQMAGVQGQKCYETGTGFMQSNDGIMSDVGEGTWVVSFELKEGNTNTVELKKLTLTCTDEEGSKLLLPILAGCAVGALLIFLCGFRFCFGKYLVENCCPCFACCCCKCMFPEGTELGDKDNCDDYMLYRCVATVCFCFPCLTVRSKEEREKEYMDNEKL